MKNYKKYGMAAVIVIIAGMGLGSNFALGAKAKDAAPETKTKVDAGAVVDTGWKKQCAANDKKKCEVSARLEMKASSMRVAEVQISYPTDKNLPKGTASGVIILPLGILLQPGVTMAVDNEKPVGFSSKFCTQNGCFSIVNLNKDLIDSMKNGKYLNIYIKTADNQAATLTLGLESFKKAISQIE